MHGGCLWRLHSAKSHKPPIYGSWSITALVIQQVSHSFKAAKNRNLVSEPYLQFHVNVSQPLYTQIQWPACTAWRRGMHMALHRILHPFLVGYPNYVLEPVLLLHHNAHCYDWLSRAAMFVKMIYSDPSTWDSQLDNHRFRLVYFCYWFRHIWFSKTKHIENLSG